MCFSALIVSFFVKTCFLMFGQLSHVIIKQSINLTRRFSFDTQKLQHWLRRGLCLLTNCKILLDFNANEIVQSKGTVSSFLVEIIGFFQNFEGHKTTP
jgi:hypothetical protein